MKNGILKILKSCFYLNKYYQRPWGIRMFFVQMRAWLTQWRIWSYRCSLPARKRSWDETHFVNALFQLWLDHTGFYLWANTVFKTPEEGIRRPKKARSPSTDVAGMGWADPDRQTNWGVILVWIFWYYVWYFTKGGICFDRNCGLTPVSWKKGTDRNKTRSLYNVIFSMIFLVLHLVVSVLWSHLPFSPHTRQKIGCPRVHKGSRACKWREWSNHGTWDGYGKSGVSTMDSNAEPHLHRPTLTHGGRCSFVDVFYLEFDSTKCTFRFKISPPVKMHSIETKNGLLEER